MRRITSLACVAVLLGTSITQAYTDDYTLGRWETSQSNGERSAFVCNEWGEGGEAICVVLSCRAGGPMELVIYNTAYGGVAEGSRDYTLTVDGTARIGASLRTALDDGMGYTGPMPHAGESMPFLNALRTGQQLTLRVPPHPEPTLFRLAGSSRAIDRLLAFCPLGFAAPPVAVSSHPVAASPAAPPPGKTKSALPSFAAPLPPPLATITAPPADGRLDALALRDRILDRRITWGDGAASVTFRPGGRFEATQNGHTLGGNWQMVTDGRICWSDGSAQGCFRFLEQGPGLALRLEAAGKTTELGTIRFE